MFSSTNPTNDSVTLTRKPLKDTNRTVPPVPTAPVEAANAATSADAETTKITTDSVNAAVAATSNDSTVNHSNADTQPIIPPTTATAEAATISVAVTPITPRTDSVTNAAADAITTDSAVNHNSALTQPILPIAAHVVTTGNNSDVENKDARESNETIKSDFGNNILKQIQQQRTPPRREKMNTYDQNDQLNTANAALNNENSFDNSSSDSPSANGRDSYFEAKDNIVEIEEFSDTESSENVETDDDSEHTPPPPPVTRINAEHISIAAASRSLFKLKTPPKSRPYNKRNVALANSDVDANTNDAVSEESFTRIEKYNELEITSPFFQDLEKLRLLYFNYILHLTLANIFKNKKSFDEDFNNGLQARYNNYKDDEVAKAQLRDQLNKAKIIAEPTEASENADPSHFVAYKLKTKKNGKVLEISGKIPYQNLAVLPEFVADITTKVIAASKLYGRINFMFNNLRKISFTTISERLQEFHDLTKDKSDMSNIITAWRNTVDLSRTHGTLLMRDSRLLTSSLIKACRSLTLARTYEEIDQFLIVNELFHVQEELEYLTLEKTGSASEAPETLKKIEHFTSLQLILSDPDTSAEEKIALFRAKVDKSWVGTEAELQAIANFRNEILAHRRGIVAEKTNIVVIPTGESTERPQIVEARVGFFNKHVKSHKVTQARTALNAIDIQIEYWKSQKAKLNAEYTHTRRVVRR